MQRNKAICLTTGSTNAVGGWCIIGERLPCWNPHTSVHSSAIAHHYNGSTQLGLTHAESYGVRRTVEGERLT